MLLTTCPNCQAQFKVTPEQLNVRSGRVMCGRCRHVFNSFESLQRIDSTLGDPPDLMPVGESTRRSSLLDETPAPARQPEPPLADPQSSWPASSLPAQPSHAAADSSLDGYSLTDDLPAETHAPAPVEQEEPAIRTFIHPVDESPIADAAPSSEPASSPFDLTQTEAAKPPSPMAMGAPYRNAPLLPKEAPSKPSALWSLLAIVAVLGFVAQGAYGWRSEIVSQYPALRPAFDKACESLGCNLPWGRDATLIKVDSSDLIEELGSKGRFLLTATFTNRAASVQDYPYLELSLTDTNNQTLTRRVLPPEAYLGRKPARGEGLAPGATAPVNVRIESQLPGAAGYHLEPIFP